MAPSTQGGRRCAVISVLLRAWVVVCLIFAAPPLAAQIGPIDSALQFNTSEQYQSNPARLPDSDDRRRGAFVFSKSVGLGLRVPLLSDETRLDLVGNLADVRYSNNHQLNHQPRNLRAVLNWRATPLFVGRINFGQDKQFNRYSSRTFPDRDMLTRQNVQAEVGMRVTERLTLPVISVFRADNRYDQAINKTLYNRDETGWQVAGQYQGYGRSFAQAGFRHTGIEFPRRGSELAATIDDAYDDNEVFISTKWDYSPKTLFDVRLGYLRRQYRQLSDRDTGLMTAEVRALWDYSPKTQFDFRVWQRPYANDDDPRILYSKQTGAMVGAIWRPTVKTTIGAGVEGNLQQNTVAAGFSQPDQKIWRYGVRAQWQAQDNLRFVFDVYRDRQSGTTSIDSYTQSYARIGVEYTFGKRLNDRMTEMLRPSDCEYRRPEYGFC